MTGFRQGCHYGQEQQKLKNQSEAFALEQQAELNAYMKRQQRSARDQQHSRSTSRSAPGPAAFIPTISRSQQSTPGDGFKVESRSSISSFDSYNGSYPNVSTKQTTPEPGLYRSADEVHRLSTAKLYQGGDTLSGVSIVDLRELRRSRKQSSSSSLSSVSSSQRRQRRESSPVPQEHQEQPNGFGRDLTFWTRYRLERMRGRQGQTKGR